MNFKKRADPVSAEPNMTPMIDMTFQLIIFFMVALNFGEGEQDARIKLPISELAKPPDAAHESAIVMQLTSDDMVLFSGEKVPLAAIDRYLGLERQFLEAKDRKVADATIIIRADANARTGVVQELIKKCQENKFQQFVLRAKNEPQ